MMDLLLYGAVPLKFPEESSLAARRRMKTGTVADVTLEQAVVLEGSRVVAELSSEQALVLEVAREAADLAQFLFGPQHRASTSNPVSPSYRNSEVMTCHCPSHSPVQQLTVDLSATDANCESSTEEELEMGSGRSGNSGRSGTSGRSEVGRKRRRLVSFSGSAPSTRRVANKKLLDELEARMIFNSRKEANIRQEEQEARKTCSIRKQEVETRKKLRISKPAPGTDLTNGSLLSRLHFMAQVQATMGDGEPARKGEQEQEQEQEEKEWRKLGKSLRAIADRLGGESLRSFGQGSKEISMEALPSRVWSTLNSYVFWKLIEGFK